MALFWDGVAAFLEAIGIAAVLWVLSDWIMYPKRAAPMSVLVPLSGNADGLEPLLRRLTGLSIILVDDGLSGLGLERAAYAAAHDPNITLKKRGEIHGGADHH